MHLAHAIFHTCPAPIRPHVLGVALPAQVSVTSRAFLKPTNSASHPRELYAV